MILLKMRTKKIHLELRKYIGNVEGWRALRLQNPA